MSSGTQRTPAQQCSSQEAQVSPRHRVHALKAALYLSKREQISAAYLMNLESVIYKMWCHDVSRYWTKCREMVYCMVIVGGTPIRQTVCTRTAMEVGMNGWGDDLLPSTSAAENVRNDGANIRYLETADLEVEASVDKKDVVRCVKCKSTDVAWRQLQTRGADEPMSTFYNCKNCGSKWRN